jgi:MFS family permease
MWRSVRYGGAAGSARAVDDLHPAVLDLQLHRRLLAHLHLFAGVSHLAGHRHGAEWPVGAALATESWLARSRGLMASVLQGSWGLGYLLAAVLYATLYDVVGWRDMLWIGVLPASSQE